MSGTNTERNEKEEKEKPGLMHLPKAGLKVISAVPDEQVQKFFLPRTEPAGDAWLGGDVASSLQMNKNYLWIFGDTLVGDLVDKEGEQVRSFNKMPRNSIGVSSVQENGESFTEPLTFYWNYDADHPEHVGFFSPDNTSCFYWVLQGLQIPNTNDLMLFSANVYPDKSAFFGFEIDSSVAIKVKNGAITDPDTWHTDGLITTSTLPMTNKSFQLTSAVTHDTEYAYLFGTDPNGCIVSRINFLDLDNFKWENMEFFTLKQEWVRCQEDWQLPYLEVMFSTISETTVAYNQYLGLWISLSLKTFVAPPVIRIMTAEQVTGPWSEELELYAIPAPWSTGPVFCYAPKIHMEFGQNDGQEFVITFMSNTPDLNQLQDDTQIYTPQAIRVQVEKL